MLYLVRHCQTTGQQPDAPLTPLGEVQAQELAAFLAPRDIQRIVSSTHRRAQQSVAPLAALTGIPLETDGRLVERVLSTGALPDWRERLLASWANFDLTHPGGESSRTATARALAAVSAVKAAGRLPAVIVTHGNLLALLLHALDGRPGFETWEHLTNPDVFQVEPSAASPSDSASVTGGSGTTGGSAWQITRLWPD